MKEILCKLDDKLEANKYTHFILELNFHLDDIPYLVTSIHVPSLTIQLSMHQLDTVINYCIIHSHEHI